MIYTMAVISDIHWGAMDPQLTEHNLEAFLVYLENASHSIDLLVFDGDYFDTRVGLNSTVALTSLNWFKETMRRIKSNTSIQKVRMIRGTKEHDADQLEALRVHENDQDDFFRLYNECTIEETLPGLSCLYCPEENLYKDDYIQRYVHILTQYPDVAFLHGSFDVAMPDIALRHNEETRAPMIIYEYSLWSSFVKGPMLAGHWHHPYQNGSLFSIGSYDRWKFGEEEPKGFGICQIDTESKQYKYHQVLNPFAVPYYTIHVNTLLCHTKEDFMGIMDMINDQITTREQNAKFSISIDVMDTKPENDIFIQTIRTYYLKMKGKVKITVKDKVKKEKRQKLVERNQKIANQYSFINDKKMTIPQIFQTFIREEYEEDLSLEEIDAYLGKYLTPT